MRYFQFECLGEQSKLQEHVCISKRPSGLGLKSYYDIFINEVLARALFEAKISNLFVHEVGYS